MEVSQTRIGQPALSVVDECAEKNEKMWTEEVRIEVVSIIQFLFFIIYNFFRSLFFRFYGHFRAFGLPG